MVKIFRAIHNGMDYNFFIPNGKKDIKGAGQDLTRHFVYRRDELLAKRRCRATVLKRYSLCHLGKYSFG